MADEPAQLSREWELADRIEPVAAPLAPAMISDGSGLAFPLPALTAPFDPLDPADPAVEALVAQIVTSRTGTSFRLPWKRGPRTPDGASLPSLDGWRVMTRTDTQVLFGRGRPPTFVTVLVQRDGKREHFSTVGVSSARPIRAAREDIRASSWRLDPDQELTAETLELRLLVTEQTRAGGKRADGRFLAPELHMSPDNVVIRVFVTPLSGGYQTPGPRPETPLRVPLPEPLGGREVIDGGLLWAPPGAADS
jgi:hypothetical protein